MTFINGFLALVAVAFTIWLRLIWLEWRAYKNTCKKEENE